MARLRHSNEVFDKGGIRLTAIEVAAFDRSYSYMDQASAPCFNHGCCFPGSLYQDHSAEEIHSAVLKMLHKTAPDIVFAPATAFPEGMAAISYRQSSGARVVIMDDAWQMTDHRGVVTKMVKRIIHKSVDAAFIPAPSHRAYYESLNIPGNRIVYGVDVVDNDYFASGADDIRINAAANRHETGLPDNFFLFAGRFIKKKGVDTLIEAYRQYRKNYDRQAWSLVFVGDGIECAAMKRLATGIDGVLFLGQKTGRDLLVCYGLSKALIVPSHYDQWGLVVNEGMAAGLPVIVSKGVGAAQTLVKEGVNGRTFEPGDAAGLAELMEEMTRLAEDKRLAMGEQSRKIIADWSVDRFCQGVLKATKIPRRSEAGLLSRVAVRLWKGKVTVN